ncbi:MAG: RagB/SusD family nutrient uptake outer membrane protein, partial [Sphingobacteriaceae bacterium]|nr:RagB/SusD family nutrient uptake outer membrane protein [Cytophagaceae bacterium]
RTRRPVGTLAWNADALVLPIPQRETDANPNLTQNPGY